MKTRIGWRLGAVAAVAASIHGFAVSTVAADDGIFISVDEAVKLQGNPKVRFVFADSEKDFEKSHIPGSIDAYAHDLNYLQDVRKCKGLPMCEATAFAFIGKEMGVDAGTQVIAYDNGMGVNASGVWFFLALYGHGNVRILDGGLPTWQAKGLPVATGKAEKVAAKSFLGKVQWDMIASREEVEKATKASDKYLIVDARHTIEEFSGKNLLAGLEAPGKEVTVARGGHIPTSVFSPWTKYAGNKGGEADKPVLKDKEDLAKQLERLKKNGYDEKKTVISYCHVGLGRGSFQYLAMRQAGHKATKVYMGSWNEWGNTPALPVATEE
jgi:thiosulfate/3-mercaptopyruvate sulfurtransferase